MDLGSLAGPIGAEWIGKPPHEELDRKVRPLLPSEDPFYQPPPGYQHALPGTVLRSRDVEVAFFGLIRLRATATQLLYRTMDMNGKPEAAVTTVIVPADVAPGQTCPLLSYQCAIDAVTSRCFPSYALRRHAKAIGAVPQFDFLLVSAALAKGWAVSVPDHEGRNGMWGAPYEPGYCVLDGVRAALSSERIGLSASAPVALWGYSGGGLATGWAAEICADYAPELDIVGAVLGSPVGDLVHTFRRLNGGFLAGLPALVIVALAHIYPDLGRVIREHANEEGLALLRQLETMTTAGAVIRMARKDVSEYLDRPLEEILTMPEPSTLRQHQTRHDGADTACIDRAGRTRLLHRCRRHRRARRRLFGRRSRRHLPPGRVLRAPAAAPAVRPDDAAVASDRFAGRPLTDHLIRTKWPTMFNPATMSASPSWPCSRRRSSPAGRSAAVRVTYHLAEVSAVSGDTVTAVGAEAQPDSRQIEPPTFRF